MSEATLMFWYAESALHAGGPDSVGVVDLPIQRETTTRLPTVWGQSAKGALRDHARSGNVPWPDEEAIFGSAPPGSAGDRSANGGDGATSAGDGATRPGWLAVGDVRLVAFPVPTLSRTFAWVTSPLLLARLSRSARLAGLAGLPAIPEVRAGQVFPASAGWGSAPGRLAVGDHDLAIGEPSADRPRGSTDTGEGAEPVDGTPGDGLATRWGRWLAKNALPLAPDDGTSDPFVFFREKLRTDLLVVADDDMAELTEEHAELLTRVQLEAKAKTVRHGPWYTEYLPAETLLCGLLRDCLPAASGNGSPSRLDGLRSRLDGDLLVAGGDESLGKGMLWLRLVGANA